MGNEALASARSYCKHCTGQHCGRPAVSKPKGHEVCGSTWLGLAQQSCTICNSGNLVTAHRRMVAKKGSALAQAGRHLTADRARAARRIEPDLLQLQTDFLEGGARRSTTRKRTAGERACCESPCCGCSAQASPAAGTPRTWANGGAGPMSVTRCSNDLGRCKGTLS